MIIFRLHLIIGSCFVQIYIEIDKFGDELANDAEKSLPLLLLTVDGIFSKLEASIAHLHVPPEVEGKLNALHPLLFCTISYLKNYVV